MIICSFIFPAQLPPPEVDEEPVDESWCLTAPREFAHVPSLVEAVRVALLRLKGRVADDAEVLKALSLNLSSMVFIVMGECS